MFSPIELQYGWRDSLCMKLSLLLCGAALLLAGCASEKNPFAAETDQNYHYDLVPEPLPDLTPEELVRIYETPTPGYTMLVPSGAEMHPTSSLGSDRSGRQTPTDK